jgi:hypothetical protein
VLAVPILVIVMVLVQEIYVKDILGDSSLNTDLHRMRSPDTQAEPNNGENPNVRSSVHGEMSSSTVNDITAGDRF